LIRRNPVWYGYWDGNAGKRARRGDGGDRLMNGTSGARNPRHRARWQAAALFCVIAGDGMLAYALGGPWWLLLLYGLLGIAIGAGRLWVSGRAGPRLAPAQPAQPPPPAASASAQAPVPRAIGYVRVAEPLVEVPDEPVQAIARCCEERRLALQRIVHDSPGAEGDHAQPALRSALQEIAGGEASVLVVARLRDLSSNVANLPPLLRWFDHPVRRLIAVDMQIDTSTEAGRIAVMALAGVGGWERERLSERIPRELEAARSRGGGNGQAAVADVPELRERIAAMREQGMTLQAIADRLNEDGVPTLRGGAMWRPSSVQRATGYRRPSAANRGIEVPRSRPTER
jgi:DNA invertase Pin-like site-specific DNA recombinase